MAGRGLSQHYLFLLRVTFLNGRDASSTIRVSFIKGKLPPQMHQFVSRMCTLRKTVTQPGLGSETPGRFCILRREKHSGCHPSTESILDDIF